MQEMHHRDSENQEQYLITQFFGVKKYSWYFTNLKYDKDTLLLLCCEDILISETCVKFSLVDRLVANASLISEMCVSQFLRKHLTMSKDLLR